jgi:hypothetical protein
MPQEAIGGLRSMSDFIKQHNLPEVPQELLEQIIHRDALTLLGLN